jgi:hypothetical protein
MDIKKNIICRYICFLVCSLAKIIVIRLTENEMIQFYDKIKKLKF